jgi:multisubunit Na+/H+ antiporter MnhF subunit
MLRKLALLVAAGITVGLGVLTVLVILGPGLIDPLLASDRIDTVRALVVGLLALAVACFVVVAVIDRRTARPRADG